MPCLSLCTPSFLPQRYKQLLFYASKLEPFPVEQHTEENKVKGCVSQVRFRAGGLPSVLCSQGILFSAADSAVPKPWSCELSLGAAPACLTLPAGVGAGRPPRRQVVLEGRLGLAADQGAEPGLQAQRSWAGWRSVLLLSRVATMPLTLVEAPSAVVALCLVLACQLPPVVSFTIACHLCFAAAGPGGAAGAGAERVHCRGDHAGAEGTEAWLLQRSCQHMATGSTA